MRGHTSWTGCWCRQHDSPVTAAAAVFLYTGRVGVGMTGLGEIARKTVFCDSGAISEADVVAVVGFVGASHC